MRSLKPMTNLKKLKVIKYFLALSLLFLFSCAKVPFKGLYTDNQFELKEFQETPILIFHQNDLRALLSWEYMKIAKDKLPQHKIYILLVRELSIEETSIFKKNVSLFDGYVLQKPLLLPLDTDLFREKILLNSGIINLETDDYYLSPKSKRAISFEAHKQKYLFTNNLEKLSMPQDEREFQFYLEDPLLSVLKIRKAERKTIGLNYLIIGSKEINNQIRAKTHDFLVFKTIPEPKAGYFTLGENLIEICPNFYQATEDCFQPDSSPYLIDEKIFNQREKILKGNQEKIKAKFLDVDILTTN